MAAFLGSWFREKEAPPIERPIFLRDYAAKYGMREDVVQSYVDKGVIPGRVLEGRLLLEDRSLDELRAVRDMSAESESSRYTRSLSVKEISLYLCGCVVVFPIVYWLQHSFYPWLGIPVVGISGITPFFLSVLVVGYFFFQINLFKKHEIAGMVLSVLLGIALCVFFLWFYARIS